MSPRKFLLYFLLFSFVCMEHAYSQREASRWYFGNNAGLDFNSGTPTPLLNGQLETHEGCSTISDQNGNLLFYSDGLNVWDKSHRLMPNGTGLFGHESSTQSSIIIPKNIERTQYYIFTVDEPDPDGNENKGLNYTLIDLTLNNGYGDVVSSEKNVHLVTYDQNDSEELRLKCSEKVSAVQHEDGTSTWVITHFTDSFYAFKVDENGVNATPIISTSNTSVATGGYKQNAIGYLKISPDGKNLAIAHSQVSSSNISGPKTQNRQTGKVLLYNFDANTGSVSNEQTLLSSRIPYGIEFSPKSTRLYTTVNNYKEDGSPLGSSLYQFDLTSSNIRESIKDINSSTNVAGGLQLAIDGKIYRAGYSINNSGTNISVINNPEALGTGCNYVANTISLGGRFSELGLPPYVQSLFLLKFEFRNVCLGDETEFEIQGDAPFDSVTWDFGDGATSNEVSPKHIYSAPGEYQVSLTKTVGGSVSEPIQKTLIIFDTPKTPLDLVEYYQCTNSPNSNGLAKFNLANINSSVSLDADQIINVFYYKDLPSAELDTTNTNALPMEYKNVVTDEILIAKVLNPISLCHSYAEVKLKVKQTLTLDIPNLKGCALEDGTGEFHLDVKRQAIRNALNLGEDSTIQFYLSENKALLGSGDYLPDNFISNSGKIYVRVENKNICYGSGSFDIEIEQFEIDPTQNVLLCDADEKGAILTSGIKNESNASYTYTWSTGEITPSITTTEQGIYYVTVTNDNGCSATSTISVEKTELPDIKNIKISNDVIEVIIDNNELFEYSLEYDGNYQQNNIFKNVATGTHMVYVRNIDGCGVTSQEVSVLAYPKFFTPNGDQSNDYWQIEGFGSENQISARISIFDRFGSLLAQIDPNSRGWDGNFNGQPLQSSDYWFSVSLANGRLLRGHFTLKR